VSVHPSGITKQPSYDVAVVGGGPAGLAATVATARLGRRVVLIDAGAQLGGQYWRHPDLSSAGAHDHAGHRDWEVFEALTERIRRHRQTGAAVHLAATQVWFIEPPGPDTGAPAWTLHLAPTCGVQDDRMPRTVRADRLILAPGCYDRQLPIPGWDLPGVMAAGGVQALLKGQRTLAGKRAVVAGTGPFLLPVAAQLARNGAKVVAVCEANRIGRWAKQPLALARTPAKLAEAASYGWSLARARIPYLTGTVVMRIEADSSGNQVGTVKLGRLRSDGGVQPRPKRLEVDLVALGWGFTPALELVSASGAETRVDVDRSLVAVVDDRQQSTVAGLYIAGEATGVGGAQLALAEGELAGIAAADATHLERSRVRALGREIRRLRAFAVAMHRSHPVPPRWSEWLTPETIVCRCEEVTYARVSEASTRLGATDARTLKLLTRCGMGWCQGHVCGFATAALAAAGQTRPLNAEDLRPLAKQFPCAPVPLGSLLED
jgi:NADP-dependent aldehyde dehydrogenase